MNTPRLTFFNFAGYFVPGIAFIFMALFIGTSYPKLNDFLTSLIHSLETFQASWALVVATLAIPVLGLSMLIGVIVSDLAMWIIGLMPEHSWNPKRQSTPSLFKNGAKLTYYQDLLDEGRDAVLANSFLCREMLALSVTGGWDQYGAAGRNRMLLACGVIALVGGLALAPANLFVGLSFVMSGALLVWLGKMQNEKYNRACDCIAFLEVSQKAEVLDNSK